MRIIYFCEGSVRGRCQHNHRTLRGAERCLAQDVAGCHTQGGWSDREIQAEDSDGVPLCPQCGGFQHKERDAGGCTCPLPTFSEME